MTTEKVNDLEVVPLLNYFDPKKFRLIPADATQFKGGITEVPVSINLHQVFSKGLNFDTRNLQKLYGFGILTGQMIAVNGGQYYSKEYNGKLKAVELNDCGDLWIMKFEFFEEPISLKAVKDSEVLTLLNGCLKPLLLDVTIL